MIRFIGKDTFVSMHITPRCTHKIAVIDRSGTDVHITLHRYLESNGISSQFLEESQLDSDILIDSNVLFIRMGNISRESLKTLMSHIPELAGVLAVYKEKVRTYQVLRDTAAARSERVAMVGAIFIGPEESSRGLKLCREIGIPYLGNGKSGAGESVVSALSAEALVRLFSAP